MAWSLCDGTYIQWSFKVSLRWNTWSGQTGHSNFLERVWLARSWRCRTNLFLRTLSHLRHLTLGISWVFMWLLRVASFFSLVPHNEQIHFLVPLGNGPSGPWLSSWWFFSCLPSGNCWSHLSQVYLQIFIWITSVCNLRLTRLANTLEQTLQVISSVSAGCASLMWVLIHVSKRDLNVGEIKFQ